ncbi:protein BNIP5 [Lepus europaeus]|uniref:protein BNIP5 n=1 Tax=Lepus europaeus TaxID=9983 RepID=UPI002B4AA896|nr:protein BNIP5 [Lepus europaeus]
MENQRGPRKPLAARRARSLDRPKAPPRGSTSGNLSQAASPRRALRRTASDGAKGPESPALSVGSAALPPEDVGEQRPLQDAKRDKAPRWWAQPRWLKTLLSFLLRAAPEEPKEKAGRRPRGKEGFPQASEPPEAAGEPACRKKVQDTKGSRRKSGSKRPSHEETNRTQDVEAGGQEAGRPRLSPAHGGGEDDQLHQSLLTEGEGVGVADVCPQATDPRQEEALTKPDQDVVIQMIVQLLRRVGDQLEEEVRVGPALPAPARALRKRSHERKSSLKSAFSPRKPSSEAPRAAGPADGSSSDARPPKRPGFLPLCVGGHRPSIPGSPGRQGPEVALQLDRASESKEFIRKITALLRDVEGQGSERLQVQEAPPCRSTSHEKKSTCKKAFAQKRHGSKEPKRAGAAAAGSPDPRPPKRPSFLPLCVGGHRPSVSGSFAGIAGMDRGITQSLNSVFSAVEELLVRELVALLQAWDGQLGKQIRRHPSLKMVFYEFPDSSLRTLVATLRSQEAPSPGSARSLVGRPYPFALSLANKFAGNHSHASCRLMGSRGHCCQHSYAHFPHTEGQLNITSPESQSPD